MGEIFDKARGLIRSRFFRDGAALASGSLIAQALAIVTAPIMARLYAPADYGVAGMFIAVYGLASVPATFQYSSAVLLPKDDDDAFAIMKGGLLLSLVTAAAIALVACLPIHLLTQGSEYESVVVWLPLMAAIVIPGSFTTFASSWLSRKQAFRLLSISRIVTNVSSTATGILLGYFAHAPWGLIVANASGMLAGTCVLAYGLKLTGGTRFVGTSWSEVKRQLINFRQFPLYATPTQFLGQATRQSPIFLLNAFVGPQAVGHFNMSNRLLGLPNTLFAESLTEVFRQRVAKQYAEAGDCLGLYRKMFWGLLLMTLPSITLLALIAPDLFAFLLGERWRAAGQYSRILCWLFGLQLVCGPLSSMMIIARRQAEDLLVQITHAVVLVTLMSTAYVVFESLTAMLIAYVAASGSMYLYYGIRGFWLAGANRLTHSPRPACDPL